MSHSIMSPKCVDALKEAIESDRYLGVAMFAVVQKKKTDPFQFRTVDVSANQQTEEFDIEIVSGALKEYADTDKQFLTLDEAMDLRNSIALLPIQDFVRGGALDESDENEEEFQLLSAFLEGCGSLIAQYDKGGLRELSSDDFSDTKGLLFLYQFGKNEVLYGYQKMVPSALLQQSSLLLKMAKGHRYQLFTDESIRISKHFDFIFYGDYIAASKPSTLIQQFGLIENQKRRALKVVEAIDCYFESTDMLVAKIASKRVRVISKILKIAKSPVLNMNAAELRHRLQTLSEYADKFRFDDNNRIIITDTTAMNDALKMLNDEIVRSPLSDAVYESEFKARIK